MTKIYLLLLISFFISSDKILASTATVKLVRGSVTVLKPGDKEASIVKRGEKIPQDSSVVTASKSIVRLKLADNSTISLGPKSMMVIRQLGKKKKSIFGMLNGVIRAEVTKSKNDSKDSKLFIQTRNAVMGVRGTVFKTTYNAINKNTSIVTLEGEVAMVKFEEKAASKVVAEEKIAKKTVEESGDKVVEKTTQESLEKDLDKILDSKETVSVTKGQFSGVVKNLAKPTVPVKVAPKQIVAMIKNDELAVKKVTKTDKEIIEEIYSDEELDIEKAKENASASTDKITGELKPKAGGFVDFKTGLYVAPAATAKFDEINKVFVAEEGKVGDVDMKTGEYVPPKGIIIDVEKGFIIDQKVIATLASNESVEDLQRTIGSLNNNVKEQTEDKVVEENIQSLKTNKPFWKFDAKERNHILSVELVANSYFYTLENTYSNSSMKLSSSSSTGFEAHWKTVWSETFYTVGTLGVNTVEVDDPSGVSIEVRGADNLFKMNYAFHYQYKEKLSFYTGVGFAENYFFEPYDNNKMIQMNLSTFRMSLGAKYLFYEKNKLAIFGKGSIELFGESEEAYDGYSVLVDGGVGIKLEALAFYNFTRKYKIEAKLYYQNTGHTISNYLDQNTKILGVGTNFIWDI